MRRVRWAALALMILLPTLVGGRASAVVPGGDGLIAFTSNTGGNLDIDAIQPCG